MRPITRRLRVLAAVLGLAQGVVLSLGVAHELSVRDYVAAAAHAEPLGATHESPAHSHECGICRNHVSKAAAPPARTAGIAEVAGSRACEFDGPCIVALGDDGPVALPRAPPVG